MPSGTFSQGIQIGLIFVVLAACLSTCAVVCLLLYIGSSVILNPGLTRGWNSTHVHYYFVNLLLCEVVQGIGGILTVIWVAEKGVTAGPLCTTQGVIQQIGDVGVALNSLAIAGYTFCVLALRWHPPFLSTLVVIAAIWTFLSLITGIALAVHQTNGYYGDTGYWCWITERFEKERIALEYFWMWLAAFGNIVIYILLAFLVKGFISFSGFRVHFHRRVTVIEIEVVSSDDSERSRTSAIAVQMLFYPAVYTITVFPMTIARWLSFSGTSVPFAATAFASVTFWSSGLFNVILFALTRPRLLPRRYRPESEPSSSNALSLKSPLTPLSTDPSPDTFSDIEDSERRMSVAYSPPLSPVKSNSKLEIPSPSYESPFRPSARDSDGSMTFMNVGDKN